MSDLKLWLEGLGLGKYLKAFQGHDVDLSVVPDLTDEDLEKIGLSLGHRRKFLAAAAKLRAEAPSLVEPMDHSPTQPRTATERRQVTVVFVDVVGSTALGAKLDPEDLLRLLRRYREECVAVTQKYEGFVAQYLGDGMLVYFGFPQGQEHAAERAVRAALEIVEVVSRIKRPDELPLRCRIGIATGMVISSEASVGARGEGTVVGDTPNIAARLQSLAEPGCVLVGPITYQLTKHFFEFSFAGAHEIKGFREPVAVWKVIGEAATETRFAAVVDLGSFDAGKVPLTLKDSLTARLDRLDRAAASSAACRSGFESSHAATYRSAYVDDS
jgi:class 3 adenylate cyclase